jgi:uncharacterized protein YegP (UPF0339 family)
LLKIVKAVVSIGTRTIGHRTSGHRSQAPAGRTQSPTVKVPEYAQRREGSMAGKFVLKKGASGKYHFNLVASNGQVIATSETYERKQSALHGIESVKENAPGAEIDDQTEE